ncbi:MAG: phosphatidate cytidylyltransferase [Microbacterium sp.]|uniref:phosphatidate cytidylyltransferase n=1 Tax=Microbacterium sp. TaxID=51671 RepID=UPI0039E666D4
MSEAPSGSEPGAPDDDPALSASFHEQMRARRTDFENQVAHARAEFDQANERIKARTGRDLLLAIVIGLAIGAVVFVSLVFFAWPFMVFATAAALLGQFELIRALQAAGRRLDVVPLLLAGVAIMLAAWFLGAALHWVVLFAGLAFVVVWRLIAQMSARDGRRYGAVLDDVLVSGFVLAYVPFLASLALILLRQDHGAWWVMAFLIIAIAADTGAYATGLLLGRHPMAPKISPKKTWEGFAGAAVFAVVAGVLLAWLMLGLPWWTGVILGIAILGSATAGDLGESMLKRDLGIKDMSSWLPGHGGVLDRLDSILPSAAVALALSFLLSPLAVTA